MGTARTAGPFTRRVQLAPLLVAHGYRGGEMRKTCIPSPASAQDVRLAPR
jgi:hypothetical protein